MASYDASRPFWARNELGETSIGETYRSRNVRIPLFTREETTNFPTVKWYDV